MSRIPCPVDGCDLPARSGLMCGACEAELARALASVPDVLADLDAGRGTTPSGAARMSAPSGDLPEEIPGEDAP